jgi:hypothetical protein
VRAAVRAQAAGCSAAASRQQQLIELVSPGPQLQQPIPSAREQFVVADIRQLVVLHKLGHERELAQQHVVATVEQQLEAEQLFEFHAIELEQRPIELEQRTIQLEQQFAKLEQQIIQLEQQFAKLEQ